MLFRANRFAIGALGLLGFSVVAFHGSAESSSEIVKPLEEKTDTYPAIAQSSQCPYEQDYRDNLHSIKNNQEQVFSSGCGGLF